MTLPLHRESELVLERVQHREPSSLRYFQGRSSKRAARLSRRHEVGCDFNMNFQTPQDGFVEDTYTQEVVCTDLSRFVTDANLNVARSCIDSEPPTVDGDLLQFVVVEAAPLLCEVIVHVRRLCRLHDSAPQSKCHRTSTAGDWSDRT